MFNFDFGDSWSSKNSQSPLLRGGTQMDPLVGLFPNLGNWKIKTGDKLQNWVSDNIAKKDPLIKKDRAHGLASWSKEARGISDWAQEKPLDATALVLGGVLGGGAAAGAWGGGGAGAGAGAGGAAGGTAAGAGGLGTGGTVAGFMPGSAAGAGLEGVTVLGSSGGAGLSAGSAAALSAAGVGGATAAQPQGQGNSWRDWMDRAQQLQSNSGGQQQQSGAPQQQGAVPGHKPTMMEKIRAGLGRVGETMFPIDQAYGMSPAQQQAARKNAYLQMGLGMMAASGGGAGFGEAAAFGLGKAQHNLTGALQRGYENARENRQEQRQKELDDRQMKRDEVSDNRWASEMEYRQEQDRIQNEQQQRAYDRAIGNDERSESWARLKYEQDEKQFDQSMRLREAADAREQALLGAGAVPSGYRRTKDGNLEPIKGGPADPQNKTGNYQEAERTAAFLGTRVADGLRTLQSISTENQTPGLAEKGLQAMGADTIANVWRNEDRQRANAAQRDVLDAGLTLATGAAYTKEQIEAMRESYFPQIGDSDAVKADKAQRLQMLLDAAKVKAGRAAEQIDKVLNKGGASGKWSIEEVP